MVNPYGIQPQYYDEPQVIPQEIPPEYERGFDQIENYGSIIKDLTDTEKLLFDYELRLTGKKLNDKGEVIRDKTLNPLINDEQTAKEFVEIIRSVANQNTHFSGYDDNDVYNGLQALNYTVNRWLMIQKNKVPIHYRQKISLEAMNICKASLKKANKALILQWSKGNIKEGRNVNYNQGQQKRGLFDWFMPKK